MTTHPWWKRNPLITPQRQATLNKLAREEHKNLYKRAKAQTFEKLERIMELKAMLDLLPSLNDNSLYVYVAGPYTQGDMAVNVGYALDIGYRLMLEGFIPYIPHLSHFMHMLHPQPRDHWLILSAAWLNRCAVVFNQLPGAPSEGRDLELELARWHGIPIVETFSELRKYKEKACQANPTMDKPTSSTA